MRAAKSPARETKDFPNKYLNTYQPESTAKERNNELILIKALRKELAAKNRTLAELKKQLPTQDMSGFAADNSNNTIIVGAGQQCNIQDFSADSADSVDADAQYKQYLQSKYERKLEETLEAERETMRLQFEHQLDESLQLFKEEIDRQVGLKQSELQLEYQIQLQHIKAEH